MELGTLARAYDRSAADYDERFRELQRPKYRAAAALLEPRAPLPPDSRVLDAGAGTGLLSEWLADPQEPFAALRVRLQALLVARRFIGLDASREMVRRARARLAQPLLADLARPPFRPHSFELVLSFTALLDRVPDSVRALAALVKTGGHLCVSFLAAESPSERALQDWSALRYAEPPRRAGQDAIHLLQRGS